MALRKYTVGERGGAAADVVQMVRGLMKYVFEKLGIVGAGWEGLGSGGYVCWGGGDKAGAYGGVEPFQGAGVFGGKQVDR